MFFRPPPMLLGLVAARFIAAGIKGAGPDIPVAASGAAVGDLIVVYSPFGGAPTLGGSGWSGWTDNYSGGSYTCAVRWKVLDATTDITISGDTYGIAWGIWRNVRSVARNAFADNTLGVTFAAPGGAAAALGVFASIQTSDQPAATASGFTNRASGWNGSTFNVDLLANDAGGPAGLKTIGGWAGANAQTALTAFELRA
jgi:hypothetical protein